MIRKPYKCDDPRCPICRGSQPNRDLWRSPWAALILAGIAGALIALFPPHAKSADDGLFLELGAGAAVTDKHDGRNPRSVIRLRYETGTERWWAPDVVEYNHHSSIPDGSPFNNNPESTVDQASVIWRIKLY